MAKKSPKELTSEQKQISSVYNNLVNFVVNNFLFNVYGILLKSGVCPETTSSEWLKTLAVMHVKGWLYYGYENGQIKVVVGAYRIKELDEKKIDVLPTKEEGDILYVAFMASTAEDKLLPKKMLTKFLNQNKNIKEVIIYRRNNEKDLQRLKVNRKEDDKNVKEESTESTEVPAESVRKPESATADAAGTKS